MTDTQLTAAYSAACKQFALAAADPSATWEQWKAAWETADGFLAALTGRKPRQASYHAYRTRNSMGATGRAAEGESKEAARAAKKQKLGAGARG